jgi:hypothetical protein
MSFASLAFANSGHSFVLKHASMKSKSTGLFFDINFTRKLFVQWIHYAAIDQTQIQNCIWQRFALPSERIQSKTFFVRAHQSFTSFSNVSQSAIASSTSPDFIFTAITVILSVG